MQAEIRILSVEDSAADGMLLGILLKNAGIRFALKRVETVEDFLLQLKSFKPDLVCTDYNLPGFNALDVAALLKREKMDIPIVLVTGSLPLGPLGAEIEVAGLPVIQKDDMRRLPGLILRLLEKSQKRA